MTENVRLQNLREFTVQIRRAETDQIVGTGIAVSTSGKIVTCRHVVEAAIKSKAIDGAQVGVYFPQARGGDEKNRRATVAKYFEDHDDDVVLLQLTGGPSPLGPEQIPVLGGAGASEGNTFRSYGYRSLEKYIAGRADGTIQGCVEAPEDFDVQCEPVQLESSQINAGMSGSAVLDTTRNLVIGIVSETWFPDLSTKDRDTAWAVDGRVLGLAPLGLQLQDAPLPLKAAPSPKTDIAAAQAAVAPVEKYVWNSAPAVLDEWTGRDELLKQLTEDWNNPKKRITGLIGFGGEGKSSLARKWVDDICRGDSRIAPTGIFWWGFYENRSIDEFLEAALKYLGGGRIDPRQIQSSSLRAQIIGAMLGAGRYLFVLDGLEVAQHQDGDQYGLLQNNDLRDLLTFFARPDHPSFCLVTSRAPLLDLMDYTTYTHRDLERLLPADGRALLERVGVKGTRAQLDQVVSDWDGHALTLSLLGSYLSEHYGGEIAHLADLPAPTADEPRYERVHRVLRRYDEHLTETEREFLKLFSAFRTPVHEGAFEKVFVPLLDGWVTRLFSKLFKRKKTIAGVNESPLRNVVNRLVTYRILRHDAASQTYTAHPLVRNHYLAILTKDTGTPDTHLKIKDYYLSIAGDTPKFPTLDDLKPLIEVVHHACQAGAYDEAWNIHWNHILQQTHYVTVHQLGAFETEITTVQEFFPKGDILKEPQTSKSDSNCFILNQIGVCLMGLGRLRDVVPFFERAAEGYLSDQNWGFSGRIYQNLAELHTLFGALDASAAAALQALEFARRAENKNDEATSQSWLGTAMHLLGKTDEANLAFLESERIRREAQPNIRYLYSFSGIRHADHLRRTGQSDYSRRVTAENLKDRENRHLVNQLSDCYRVLGDLDSDAKEHVSARAHYESALKIARGTSHRRVLIEALLARGRWVAKEFRSLKNFGILGVDQAFNDLNEALGYCVEGGYRIYEADVRVALGWAYLAQNEKQKAKESASRALQMSEEMGYYWGKLDAGEVMERAGGRE